MGKSIRGGNEAKNQGRPRKRAGKVEGERRNCRCGQRALGGCVRMGRRAGIGDVLGILYPVGSHWMPWRFSSSPGMRLEVVCIGWIPRGGVRAATHTSDEAVASALEARWLIVLDL